MDHAASGPDVPRGDHSDAEQTMLSRTNKWLTADTDS
jgi:hypothetical protein